MITGVPARKVADLCREQALREDIDTLCAVVLLMASKEIEKLADRIVQMASTLEKLEMKNDS